MAIFNFSIDGGVNTEQGPSAPFRSGGTLPDRTTVVSVPWLIEAQNVIYHLDGWPQKMPGASRVNAVATGATDSVMGLFDYWRSTTTTSPVQRRIAVAGDEIFREDLDGVFDSILSGLELDRMPAFEVMNDDLVIATTSNTDVPQRYDQTTIANLGGSPPNFAFHVKHKNRMWAMGVNTNKSRLYYSALDNHQDWTGAGSGSIDVAPDDGDVGTGLASYKDELWIFKGPHRGSIHRLAGSAPTGSDAFSLHPFVNGVGASNHQSIIVVRDDLWFWDDNGIHSLVATSAFGDYTEAFLSRDISTYFVSQLNHSRFDFVWGVNFAGAGYALWTVSRSGQSQNDLIVLLDYRFSPARFAFWPVYNVASLAMIRDTNRETVPWAGTYTGRALRMNREGRNVEGTAYTSRTLWPYLSFGDPFFDKEIPKGRIGYAPKGDTTFSVGWQRDGNTQQTASVSQGGVPTLGASANQFTLDTDVLGGGRHLNQFFDMGGSFKEVQIEMTQGTVDVDFEPHSAAFEIEGAGIGTTATVG